MPVTGDLLGDRYRLDDRIAAGGMGEVWQATDTVLGRDVAVKTLHADRAGDPGFQTRFRHEARAMAVLHHPNIADVYDYGQSGTDAYIVMARVDGQPLSERIAERGRLTAAETLSVVTQAGCALDAAHRAGIVHRDVKPGNLILQRDGTVVLVDFGVARSAESSDLTGVREVVGTALYIAPEQVSKQVTGPAADIYALGAVAYHCLAGRPPFLGDNPITVALHHLEDDPPDLPADVPEPVRALVATAMAKNPADRYPSAAAMAAAATLDGTASDSRTAAAAGGEGAGAAALAAHDTRRATADAAEAMAVRPTPGGADTAVLSATAAPAKRRRGSLIAGVLGLLILAAVAAVLAFANPGNVFPGDQHPGTAVTSSTGTSGAPVSSAGAGTHSPADNGNGAGSGGTTTTHPGPSATATVRPTRSAGAPTTSATPSRAATSSPRTSATTRTTASRSAETSAAAAQETTAAVSAAATP